MSPCHYLPDVHSGDVLIGPVPLGRSDSRFQDLVMGLPFVRCSGSLYGS